MATITENLETLKTNVARMKEAIGVPPETPLEDITKTIEDNSNTIQSGVVVIKDESELETIEGYEGLLALKYENSLRNPTASESLKKLYFPDSFTLDAVVTTSSYGMYRDTSQTIYRTRIYLTATTFYVMDEYDYIQIVRYASTDGKTYTKQAGYEDVIEYECPGNQTRYSYTGETYLNATFVKSIDFKLWRYIEGSWNYADIGCDISEDQIFKPGEAYSNKGKVAGNQSRNEYRLDNIFVQTAEPETKEGLWCYISSSQIYNIPTYDTKCPVIITDLNVENPNNVLNLVRSSRFKVVPNYAADAYTCCSCNDSILVQNLTVYYNGSSTGYAAYGVLDGGIFRGADKTSGRMYNYDFVNNTRTAKATAPSGFTSNYIIDVGYYDNKIYYLTRNAGSSSSGYITTIFVYDIAGNTWTSHGFGNPGSAYSMPESILVTDTYVYYTYKLVENYSSHYIRRIRRDIMQTISTINVNLTDYDSTVINTFRSIFRTNHKNRPYKSEGTDFYWKQYYMDLSTFTADAIISQITAENFDSSVTSHIEYDGYLYNLTTIEKFLDETNEQTGERVLIPYITSDGVEIETRKNFIFRYGDILYAFDSTGTSLYSMDLSLCNRIPYCKIAIQTSQDGTLTTISENLTLKVKNVWSYDWVNTTSNIIKKVYVGNGTNWVLIKDNS